LEQSYIQPHLLGAPEKYSACCLCRPGSVVACIALAAILKQLGIITSKTRVAGASGGSINAALTCSSMPLQQQYTDLSKLASMCRPARGCAGSLDKEVEAALRNALPADAAQLCSGRLWVSITAATPQNRSDENVLLGSSWKSNAELISAARLSSFIPGFSGGSATKQLPEVASVGNAYDGGFSQNLPCPPGRLDASLLGCRIAKDGQILMQGYM
jgi:hypothetical protein